MPGKRTDPNAWWICDDCGLCICPCCEDYCRCHCGEQFDGRKGA